MTTTVSINKLQPNKEILILSNVQKAIKRMTEILN